MRPTISQYAQALDELSSAAPAEARALGKNFVNLLKRRGETDKVGAVLASLERLEQERRGEVAVSVHSAHALNQEMEAVVLKKIATLFPGKTPVLTYVVDPAVIGGVRLRSKEILYDATLSQELLSLKKAIK